MPEETHPLVQLSGSERAPMPEARPAGELDTSERAEVTLILRRRAEIPAGIVAGPGPGGWGLGLGPGLGAAVSSRMPRQPRAPRQARSGHPDPRRRSP
jgi:hypothetical protein